MIRRFEKHKGNYGRIRIRKELLAKNINVSEYRIAKMLKKHGLIAKSGRTGKPRKPKPTESFWKTLECEMDDISHFTFEKASRTIVDYMELYYNSERLHSGIGYYVPNYFSLFYLSTILDKFRGAANVA